MNKYNSYFQLIPSELIISTLMYLENKDICSYFECYKGERVSNNIICKNLMLFNFHDIFTHIMNDLNFINVENINWTYFYNSLISIDPVGSYFN
jgi:hypothetical protein